MKYPHHTATVVCVWFVGLLCPSPSVHCQITPLSLTQIEKLIQIHSPDDLIAKELRSRGVGFVPNADTLERLRKLGAGPATLAALHEKMPTATLEVDSLPNSHIVLDGTDHGFTDSQGRSVLSDLPAGPHALSMQNTGYKAGNYEITLSPNERKKFIADLEWAGGYLNVRVQPAGAAIEVTGIGQYKDGIPDAQFPPGTYDLTVSLAGMISEKQSITVAAGQHASLDIHLVPDPKYLTDQLEAARLRLANNDPRGAIQIALPLQNIQPSKPDVSALIAEAYLRTDDLPHFQAAAQSAITHGGTVFLDVVHEHWELSGDAIHPARITVTAKTISYDPLSAACRHHAFTAPISNVELIEVTNKTTSGMLVVRHLMQGTFVLHLEIDEPEKRGKRTSLYLATPDSQVVRQGNIGFLSSPSNSAEVLKALAGLIESLAQKTR